VCNSFAENTFQDIKDDVEYGGWKRVVLISKNPSNLKLQIHIVNNNCGQESPKNCKVIACGHIGTGTMENRKKLIGFLNFDMKNIMGTNNEYRLSSIQL